MTTHSRPQDETQPGGSGWVVPEACDGLRLDVALSKLWPSCSRTRAKLLIETGSIQVQGALETQPRHPVRVGDIIRLVELAVAAPLALEPAAAPLTVLYEDDFLVVIDKPAGLMAHPSGPARGASVSELARRQFGELPALQGEDRPGIVHRLDQGTSGVMVLAKQQQALAHLMEQFAQRTVVKTYLALTWGEPRFDTGWIEVPLERMAAGSLRQVAAAPGRGRAATTYYEVRERLRIAALVECHPKTGRTHQIRAHLASIGHPLLGDSLYKKRGTHPRRHFEGAPALERQALHASRLVFAHPQTGVELDLSAPLPSDMAELLGWLRRQVAGGAQGLAEPT